MSYNNQDARVYGDNNVVGHGNTITRNEIHNHNGGSGGGGNKNKNSNGEEGLGVFIALGSAIAISRVCKILCKWTIPLGRQPHSP